MFENAGRRKGEEMSERTPDPRLTNPMLQVLRQRHPEVDVVELPDRGLWPADTSGVSPAVRADRDDLARQLDQTLGEVLDRLRAEAAWPDDAETVVRWRMQPGGLGHREVVSVASGLAEGDNMVLLRSCADAMLALGWRVRPFLGASPRFIARRHGLSAAVMVREAALVLRLDSGIHLLDGEPVS